MAKVSLVANLPILLCYGSVASGRTLETQNLQLTMEVLRQRYCESGDPEVSAIGMDLQFTYTNVGREVIILPKGALITYWRTGTDTINLWAQDYGHIGSVTGRDGSVRHLSSKPDSKFVVLKPGESHKTKDSFSIMSLEKLKPGKHLLQVVVEV
jgi:hypothetical protein